MAPDLSAASGDPVDEEFLDPAECYYVYGQPPPSSQGHSGYWADPRVWSLINRVAAELADGPPSPRPELIRELVHAGLAVDPDRGGEAVEVPTADATMTVDGDDREVPG